MKKLDIHGCIKSEAIIKVNAFLKENYRHRNYHALIIHGTGKKVLSKTVQELCEESPYVLDFEYAPPQIGGVGATIVYLAKEINGR